MADKEFKTKNGIIANGDITANGTLYLTLGSDAAGDIYTRAANGALTRVAKGANNTLLVVNTTGGHTYATVNSALLANNSVANQHISGANTIHGSVLVDSSVGSEQLVHADIISIVTDEPSISANSIYDDQINPNHINTAAKFESTQFAQLRVNTASAVATAGVNEDELIIENNANAGISILTPNTGTGKITFGDSASGTRASVAYQHGSDRFLLTAAGAQKLTLNSTVMAVNGTIAMTLGSDATGDIYVRSSSGTLERVAKGANGTYFGVNSTSGFQFTEFTIAADSINPSMINTAATFENTAFQVVTAGELVVSNTQPEIYLIDTDGNTGFNGTQFTEHLGSLRIQTINNSGNWISTDYLINKNASGATEHAIKAGNITRLTVNSTHTLANGILSVTGTGMFSSNLEANGTMRIIKATSGGTATGDADEIIIENNANAGISILTPNTAVGRINFGDPQNGDAGYIRYEHNENTIVLGRASQDRLFVNSTLTMNGSANITGNLDVTGNTDIGGGFLKVGIDDSVPGNLLIYGGGTGEAGGAIFLYGASDHDTETDFWRIRNEDGNFALRDSAFAQHLNIEESGTHSLARINGLMTIGLDDSVPGNLLIYGGGAGEAGGQIRIYNDADQDTTVDYWRLYSDPAGRFAITHDSHLDFFIAQNGWTYLAWTGGDVFIGQNDSVPGILHILGGGAGEAGGQIRIYNDADNDGTNEYFSLRTSGGDLGIGRGTNFDLRLSSTGALSVNGAANVGGVLTAGELIISNVSPEIVLTETDDSTGTRIVQAGGDLTFQTLNATGGVIQTSYKIFTDAAGASIHRWWVGGDLKLNITGTTTLVNTAMDILGGNLTVNGSITANDSLILPNYSAGTLQVNSTGFVIANSSGLGGYIAHADTPKTLSSSGNFTGIPSGVTELVLVLDGVTHSNTQAKVMYSRIGDSGGIETAGYASAVMGFQTGTSTLITHAINNGFTFTNTDEFNGSAIGTDVLGGVIYYKKGSGNDWAVSGTTTITGTSNTNFQVSGTKTLSGVLDRLFVLMVTANFVDGTASLYYR